MSQVPVKWVAIVDFKDEREARLLYGDLSVPVVELSALREVVAGLIQINTEMHFIKQNNQGGYIGDKEACRRAAAIAQRLLASLGEQ